MPCGLRGGGGRTDIPNSVDLSAETSVRSSTMWPPTQSMSTCALHLVRADGAPSVVLRSADFAPRARCPRQFQQLCRVKVSGPQFGGKTQNSRVVSKANSEKGISRFESCHPSHQVRSLCFDRPNARKTPQVAGFFTPTSLCDSLIRTKIPNSGRKSLASTEEIPVLRSREVEIGSIFD
jgi:hypothetical protein